MLKDHLVGMLLVCRAPATNIIAPAISPPQSVIATSSSSTRWKSWRRPHCRPWELYTLEELSRTCEDCGQKLVSLFKTRADMTQWIAWLNQPESPKDNLARVHLKKPH